MANIVGLTAARNAMAGVDLHQQGVADMPQPLAFYASDQVHNCHMKAMNLLGLGGKALRKVPSDEALRLDVDALRQAIAADRGHGAEARLRHRHGRHHQHRLHRPICPPSPTCAAMKGCGCMSMAASAR